MKNRSLEWIIGTVTLIALGLVGFVGMSFDSRLTSADNKINSVEDKRRDNETDIAVMKEMLGQVNNRTYQMDQTLDLIEKSIIKK